MIIMRALVATVLLITVVLVSIVLINANSRHERSSETFSEQDDDRRTDDKSEMEVLFESSFEDMERMNDNPGDELSTFVMEEKPLDSVQSSNGSSLLNALKKSGKVMESDQTWNSSRESSLEKETEDDAPEHVVIVQDNASNESVELSKDVMYTTDKLSSLSSQKFTKEGELNVGNVRNQADSEQVIKEELGEKFLVSKTINDIKSRSKENQWSLRKSSPAAERQTPLGYEPESYVVLDEEPILPAMVDLGDKLLDEDDLDPTISISSRPLERKQRAVVGGPETIVLNRAPIVPHLSSKHEPGCPHMFPPPSASRYGSQPIELARSSYPGMPSIYEPNHWEHRHMNMLRSPHCTACQRKQVPLCVSCGRCSECCGQSGCTCGCLNSQ